MKQFRRAAQGYTRYDMRAGCWIMVVCALALPGMAQEKDAQEEFRSRRVALAQALTDGVTILFGRQESSEDAGHSPFIQEPNFFYLSGWAAPGGAVMIVPAAEKSRPAREIFFLAEQTERSRIYEGPRLTAADPDAPSRTGFQQVLPMTALETELRKAAKSYSRIYTLTGRPEEARLKTFMPFREIADARNTIARLRLKKSLRELALIQKSIEATIEAHRAAWKRAASGAYEYQVGAAMVGTYLDKGCERNAYAPIIASGPNATVLHYNANSRRIEPGELLLMDAGASCANYAADITRTIPVDGKFTARQRELYEVVLGALKAAIAAARPGVLLGTSTTPGSLNHVVFEYINTHGKDRKGKPLGKYALHPIAHRVGLDVHDVYRETGPVALMEGDVLAIEPGIYLNDEGIGIRIEDMVHITGNGAVLLTGALPREPGDIERALAEARQPASGKGE